MKKIGVIAWPSIAGHYTCLCLHGEARCLSKHSMDWTVAEAT